MESLTPEHAGGVSNERTVNEESGAQPSAQASAEVAAAEEVSVAVESVVVVEREEVAVEIEPESGIEPEAFLPTSYVTSSRSSASYSREDSGSLRNFSFLASPNTTDPPPTDHYICPWGDETWERLFIGEQVPKCSKHKLEMIPVE